ncbi:hypothetical protein HDF18_15815 [Mucilaginibacter sp. X5P1]|uniref:hypothetical protein n=1 Tax=Mucilaginibacter sp. X5P1 TaxID=2723088 RepID=UPI001622FFBF|nr:hypothetical protein [Mucilaginibacter sp. X5P1]MBB6139089.1 hypothetical protein [Mucilaginibacter sp. X5P1]
MKAIIKHRLYFYVAILLLMAGCKLDKPDYSSFFATAGTYQPVTKGSYWTYQENASGDLDTSTTTMTGVSTVINNRTYYQVSTVYNSQVSPAESGYFSNGGHIYTTLGKSGSDTLETYYLNDTTAVNGTWIAKVNGNGTLSGFPARIAGQIVEKNISRTVNGKTFTNVIHTKFYLQQDNGTGFTTTITFDYFIAKGIGIIEQDATGVDFTTVRILLDYSIKSS